MGLSGLVGQELLFLLIILQQEHKELLMATDYGLLLVVMVQQTI